MYRYTVQVAVRDGLRQPELREPTDRSTARTYIKEQLREIYRLSAKHAEQLLDRWIAWARRCRLPSFVKLARTITAQRDEILSAIKHGEGVTLSV